MGAALRLTGYRLFLADTVFGLYFDNACRPSGVPQQSCFPVGAGIERRFKVLSTARRA